MTDLPMTDITITITGRVPVMFLGELFEGARNQTPANGTLTFEAQGYGR